MGTKILVVEDEKNLGDTLSEYLNEQGHETHLCRERSVRHGKTQSNRV